MFGNIPVLRRQGSPEGLRRRGLPERGAFNIFDELFNDAWPARLSDMGLESPWSGVRSLTLDLVENDDEFLVRAELPGVDAKDIDVTVERGTLTISGERKDEHEEKKENFLHRERVFGSFRRSVSLPGDIDEGKIKASFDKGVLNIHLPKSAERKARRIAIS